MNHSELVKELATRINKAVNIPLVNEDNEQAICELIIGILLNLFMDELEALIPGE